MPASTSRLALPYPIADDTVDVPRDVQALATKLDPAAAIYVQGAFATRPAAGVAGRFFYATDTDILYYDDGATFTQLTPPSGSPLWVTNLPSSPVFGQEVYYRAPGAPYPLWHLRWTNEWGDGMAWDFIGGSPLRANVDTDQTFVGGVNYADAATVGPQITLPLAGYYTYSYTANLYSAVQTTQASAALGLSLAGAQPAVPEIASSYIVAGLTTTITKTGELLAQPAGRVVKLMQAIPATAGGTPHTRYRHLTITPVRVG